MIDVLVMRPMLAAPHERRVFERSRPEDQHKEPDAPMRLKREMGIKPVITQGDAEAAGRKKEEEQNHLKPIEPKMPKIRRDRSQRDGQCANEKRTCGPVNSVEGNTFKHE